MDLRPVITRGSVFATVLEFAARPAYQPHISARRVLGTRHRVVVSDRVSFLIHSTFFLIQEVSFRDRITADDGFFPLVERC